MRRKRSSSGETLVETLAALLLVVLSGMLFLQMTMASTRMSVQSKEMDALYQKVLAAAEQQTSPALSTGSIDIDGRSYDVRYYAYSGASSGEKLISYAQRTGGGG
ncbi:hypothetical protein [Faecalispora jeddahensis]|uniref:hypothetical protein n=1 Tax=Faecalispora jeddahensis TaxID=1414721 RepID=UPI0027BAB76E|nr:hypothetical protein [Faecalispora jeddahensis]